MSHPEKLSIQQARKLVLHSQRLPGGWVKGKALDATLAAIEHLGYIQIDTISVIERAHNHTLWARNPRYKNDHLDRLVADRLVYEYWSHAAAWLPMKYFRHSLPRKQGIKTGKQDHWYQRDNKLVRYVLDRLTAEGPLMAKDFEGHGRKAGEWDVKPAKKALEILYMEGELMITERKNFHKVYDLNKRVLPEHVDTTTPTADEHARFLIHRFLEANGIAQPGEITYQLKNVKPAVTRCLQQMLESGELREVSVAGRSWYTLPESLELLNKPLARGKLKILSPFDNLVIQRDRMRALFDFDYLIECYVPAAKRQYGYFTLPILWEGRLVARMDCKADRKARELQILSLHEEPWLRKKDEFRAALEKELPGFAAFNGCETFRFCS